MKWDEFFVYDPSTGDLIWKERHRLMFPSDRSWRIWNRGNSGKVAGYVAVNGTARCVIVFKKSRQAHRVVWEMHNGPIQKGMWVDHINCNPLDNRIENLRLATPAQNNSNRRISKANKSGYKGVMLLDGKYVACIKVNYKQIRLGTFPTPQEAHAAYCKAAQEYRGDFAHFG